MTLSEYINLVRNNAFESWRQMRDDLPAELEPHKALVYRILAHGDLNAMKALHDALCPDQAIQITQFPLNVYGRELQWLVMINFPHSVRKGQAHEAYGETLCAAWMLAILRAIQ